ncbi:Tn3 family transposase [Brevibacillus fortis]|nr:Tn3 family transposase [Brevibacillus fortis]
MLTQLNKGESRHSLARAIYYEKKESFIRTPIAPPR